MENEIKDIKNQYDENKKLLMEKSTNDDKYITALKNELEKAKQQIVQLSNKTKEIAVLERQQSKTEKSVKLPPEYEKVSI